jgi:hypothetical protein
MKKSVLILPAFLFLLAGCSPAGGTKQPATVTIHAAETVLKEAAETVCPLPKDSSQPDPFERSYHSTETDSSFTCVPAAGHGVDSTLRLFANAEAAHAAFDAGRKQNAVEDFHGYPLAEFAEDSSDFPGGRPEYRIRLWQAGVWLAEVRAFDDTDYLIAPDPGAVSEAIYQAGVKAGLFTKGD